LWFWFQDPIAGSGSDTLKIREEKRYLVPVLSPAENIPLKFLFNQSQSFDSVLNFGVRNYVWSLDKFLISFVSAQFQNEARAGKLAESQELRAESQRISGVKS